MTFFSMINLKSLNRHYCSHFPCTHIHLIFHFFLWFHFLRKSHFIFHCRLYCLYSCQYYFNRQSLSLANHKHHYNFDDCCKDFTDTQHKILLLIVLTFLGTLCSFQILIILFTNDCNKYSGLIIHFQEQPLTCHLLLLDFF